MTIKVIFIANLVETTWLFRYPRPIDISYDQGNEFNDHELRKSLTEYEYGITAKPRTLGNPMSNAALERIHQVLRNIVRTFNISQTYIDKNYLWTVILSAAAFEMFSTTNRKKFYSPGQLLFGRDMIIPMEHNVDWELMHQ